MCPMVNAMLEVIESWWRLTLTFGLDSYFRIFFISIYLAI